MAVPFVSPSPHSRARLPAVAGEDPLALARLDVGELNLALVVLDQPRVHDPAPERWEPGEDDHPGIAGGQLRRLLEVAQRLVAAGRVGVMVGMALQVVKEDVGGDVVAVPAVLGQATLVAPVLLLLSPQ